MRNDVSKEISRFRLPSSGGRRLLLKVPNIYLKTLKKIVRVFRRAQFEIVMIAMKTKNKMRGIIKTLKLKHLYRIYKITFSFFTHPFQGIKSIPWCPRPARQWLRQVTCWFVHGSYDGPGL